MASHDIQGMIRMFKKKWLIPVAFAGTFACYSVVKKAFVDPEVRTWSRDERAAGVEQLESTAALGERLMASRQARTNFWLPRLPGGHEFDVVYDQGYKTRMNVTMEEAE